MTSKSGQWFALGGLLFVFAVGPLPQSASAALENTPNTLMGIDGMVLNAGGIFRDPGSFPGSNGNDGFNTFQFGGFSINNPITTGYGKYDAFRYQKNAVGDCCISHNGRMVSYTPEVIDDPVGNPTATRLLADSITKDYLPLINRAAFGQQFDPNQYQIQVKFKPLLQKTTADSLGTNPFPTNPTYPNITAALENTANFITVGLDSLGGYVWDAEAGIYKRANEQLTYNIGSNATPLNTWYASAPHDADGFATFSVPVTTPSFVQKGFYYGAGSGIVRDNNVNALGGRSFDAGTSTWSDVTYGFGSNYTSFGGGPADPNNPNSKLNVPNGVPGISFGAPSATVGVNLEIKSIALTRITQGSVVARIDANSGLSFAFGSGFTYGATQPPININGTPYVPNVSDQISRFDQNGMTNLIFNERTPDNPNEVNRFLIRGEPSTVTFDATNATVNVRAKLLQPLTTPGVAQSLTVYARDRKGNDNAANKGADEWDYSLDLHQFNTSTMTTVSIPLSAFTRNLTASALGPPLGFANFGDGLLTNFGLYEFGGLIPAAGGLLKLEMEYMELRTQSLAIAGDYNGDGFVNSADYTIWQDTKGSMTDLRANGDNTGASMGVIDNADFLFWKAHFGMPGAGGGGFGNQGVPEPSTLVLAALALCSAIGLQTNRRKR